MRRGLRRVRRANGFSYLAFRPFRGETFRVPDGGAVKVVAMGSPPAQPGDADLRPRVVHVVAKREPYTGRLQFYYPLPEAPPPRRERAA